jgi:hypothetical protein
MSDDGRLGELDGRLRKLETDMASLTADHKSVMSDLYGNGQKGLLDTLNEFVAAYNTRETEREKALITQQNSVRDVLDIHNKKVMRWVAIIGLLAAVLTLVEGTKLLPKGVLKTPAIIACQTATHLTSGCANPAYGSSMYSR